MRSFAVCPSAVWEFGELVEYLRYDANRFTTQTFFEESAEVLQEVADYYEKTDTDEAAALDKEYKEGEQIYVDHPCGPAAISPPTEVEDPRDRDALKAPGEPQKFDDGLFDVIRASTPGHG